MNFADDKRQPRRFMRGKRNRAMDGIIRRPAAFSGTDNINFRRPTSYQPNDQVVGNFKQPEGYHAADQGVIAANPDRISTMPAINLDLPEPKKRRKLFRLRRKKHAEHGRAKPKRSLIKRILRGLLFTFLAIIAVYAFLFIKAYLISRKALPGGSEGAIALQENVDPSLLNGEGDGRVNILILGKGGEGHTAPDLTDTIIVASIDPINKEAALLSIPRDLYVKIPNNGSMKINQVYATQKNITLASGKQTAALRAKAEKAGLDALEAVLEESLGIPIHYHSMIDFEGFKKAIDTVGGIDIDVKSSVYEVMRIDGKQYILNVKTGRQHFDGFRALAYARCRHCSPRSDFDRNQRQREIIIALKDKVLSAGTFANPIKISQLMDAFGDHVQTNLTINEVLRLHNIIKSVPGDKITSLGLADPPNNYLKTANINGLSVVIPRIGVGDYTEIQSYIRNTLKDGFIKYENASIAIYNGTSTAGLANKKAEELKSYGYNVTFVGDAPTRNYTSTVLVDLRRGEKKYTKRYLEKRLGVTATGDLPDDISAGTADFVIILGSD